MSETIHFVKSCYHVLGQFRCNPGATEKNMVFYEELAIRTFKWIQHETIILLSSFTLVMLWQKVELRIISK